MPDRLSFICNILKKSFLLVFFFTTSGCGAIFGTVTPPDGTPCVYSNSEANPYQYAIEQIANQPSDASSLYSESYLNLYGTRQKALLKLGENARHLTDWVDIATSNTSMVRISVTYLDPELIQFVLLNHFLNDPNRTVTPAPIEEFNREVNDKLLKLANRNEVLFLVTVTSPFYKAQAYNSDVVNVRVPISEMSLVNGSGKRVYPTHADYVLGANIDITHGPVGGIVGFPTAVWIQGRCELITDGWTHSLTLEIPRATLGDTEVSSQFWSIPFRALVMRADNNPVPTYDPAFQTPVAKLAFPPTPSWIPNATEDETKWELYWYEMGQYIWNFVITETHR